MADNTFNTLVGYNYSSKVLVSKNILSENK